VGLSKKNFLEIRSKYGHCSSWAIWADGGPKPKSNVGDLAVFDFEKNNQLLSQLNPNVVMVGLNISRRIEAPFGNFHDSKPQSQDYKLRHAIKDTPFYGAYMTDIIKDFEQKISGQVSRYLKENKDFERQNISLFEQELMDINSKNTLIIAFGNGSFEILDRYFQKKFKIIKVPHYSNHISQENYRASIIEILGGQK
jgi:hypothetical protein